jgi:hypothetical protein
MNGHTPGPWTAQGPIIYRGGAQVAAAFFGSSSFRVDLCSERSGIQIGGQG